MKKRKIYFLMLAALLLVGCKQKSSVDDTSLSSEGYISASENETEEAESSTEESSLEETETETETEESSEKATEDETETAATDTEAESETDTVFYSCDEVMYLTANANIRLEPSLDSGIYCILPAGTAVQLVAKSDDWAIISIEGAGTYYVSTTLLSSEDPATSEDTAEDITTTEASATTTTTGEAPPVSSVDTSNVTITSQSEGVGVLYTVGNGPLVCIDAGHQAHGNSDTEPNAPGSSVLKAKVTTGTSGVATGLAESVLNLTVSCMLRDELISRGYNVLMIRETQDVDISNAERAVMANNADSDIFIRIHANGSTNQSVSGALTMSPTAANPYVGSLYSSCRSLSEYVVNGLCAATGANNQGVYETDTMTGINWCTVPVTIVEMGYMSNPTEDTLMSTTEYQTKIVTGIANGIDAYFVSIGMR